MSRIARCIRLVVATALTLSGAFAAAQGLQVSPSSVNFGSQPVGAAGNPWTLTLNNTGSTPVTVTSIALSDAADFTLSTTCGATVGAYSNCNILVGFNPQSQGAISGAVLVTSSATAQPISVPLNGTASGSSNASQPTATFSPSSINFGNQTVGTTSNAWTVTLNNTGAGALNITSMSLSDAADFTFTTDCGATVGAYSNCHVNVSFAPLSPGNIVGKLVLMSNAATTSIALNGNGQAAASSIVVAPSQLSFGNQNVGSTSNAQVVTVSNTGSSATSMGGFNFSNSAYSVQSTTCTGTLAGNSTCNVNVVFNPSQAGAANGQMTFTAGGANQTVALNGTGVAVQTQQPTLSLSPSSVNFNTLVAGQTQTWNISVNNTSSVVASLQSAIAISGSTAFSITSSTCGTVIAANSNCQVVVTFAPQTAGNFTGQLNVLMVGANAPQVVTLSGGATANTPVVTVAPSAVNFGSVTTGQTANAWTLTVNNPGGSPITFSSPVALAGSREFQMTTTCGTGLPAYGQCQVLVSFFPVIPGQATGQVVVTVAGGATQTAQLNGNGVGPALTPGVTISPAVYDFKTVTLTTSASTTFTVKNAGSTDAYMSASASLTGSSDFAITANTCSNPVPAGTSCAVTVTYAPSAATTATGDLVMPFYGLTAPLTSGLNGTGVVPQLIANPSALNFGTVTLGATEQLSYSLVNTSTIAIPFTLSAPPAGFTAQSTCGASVAANSSCTVNVTFAPAVTAASSGSLVAVQFGGAASTGISVTGSGQYPEVMLSPGAIAFGNVNVGQLSQGATVYITNYSRVVVSYTVTIPAGFTVQSTTCVGTLTAFNACTYTIAFAPTAPTAYSGNIVVSEFGGAVTQKLPLSGTGVAPVTGKLTVNPTSLDLSSNGEGYTMLTNNGTTPEYFGYTVGDWDFYVEAECTEVGSNNFVLYPGQSCPVYVYYEGYTAGSRSTNLIFTAQDGSTASVALTFNTGPTVTPGVSITPGALAFADTLAGQRSATQNLTVSNTTNHPVLLYDGYIVNFNGWYSFTVTGGTCNSGTTITLNPGQSCTSVIAFTPQGAGPVQNFYYIYDYTDGTYLSASLVGNGLGNNTLPPTYSLSVTPGQLTLSAGQSGTATFTLTPQVGFKGTVTLSCDGLPAGATCTFVPPTLTSDGSGKVLTSQVTVSTQGISGAGIGGASRLMWLPALLMLGLLGFRKKLKVGALSVVLLAGMTAAVSMTTGCGMGLSGLKEALGLSMVTVKGTVTGANGQQQTTNFVLNITK